MVVASDLLPSFASFPVLNPTEGRSINQRLMDPVVRLARPFDLDPTAIEGICEDGLHVVLADGQARVVFELSPYQIPVQRPD